MPLLVLVNGPPASGKSTIATRLTDTRPLALALDLDVVRGLLGRWLDDSTAAGLATRSLALAMARTHLIAGHDVFVPQFLGRAEFIEQLEATAAETGSRFVEVALMIDRADAIEAFERRRAAPAAQTHVDAAALVERAGDVEAVGAMYDRYVELLDARPRAQRVEVRRGDVDGTVAAIEALLD